MGTDCDDRRDLESVISEGRIEEALWAASDSRPERVALECGNASWTFADLAQKAMGVRHVLRSQGITEGDRVVVYCRKSLESVAAMYGVWAAGAVLVPTSSELRIDQLEHVANHGQASLVVGDAALLASLAGALSVPAAPLDEVVGQDAAVKPENLKAGDTVAALLYTSGSTGLPRGIEITHDNLTSGARIVSSYLSITSADRLLSVLPFHFDYGLNQLLTTVRQRGTLVLQPSTHPGSVIRSLRDKAITGLAGVPPLWVQLMGRGSPLPKTALPRLRYMTNSGGAFPVDLIGQYRAALPECQIFLMYGLSEAFRSTYLPPEEIERRPNSMGKAIPETDVFVLRDDLTVADDDEPGVLVHRGPTVARGYFRDPESTQRVFRPDPVQPNSTDKVVFSGDLVRRDSEGFLYFVGRSDQQIKSFGHRVSPEEVEAALQRSDLIDLAIVGGESGPVSGQAIVAHVVPTSAGVMAEALDDYCRASMPRYLQPRRFVFHERFPLTSSGKVDRKRVLA